MFSQKLIAENYLYDLRPFRTPLAKCFGCESFQTGTKMQETAFSRIKPLQAMS